MQRKKPCGAGLRPSITISLEDHRVGGTEISGLKLTPSTLARSALCLKIACFLKLGAAPKELLDLTSGQALNIEPTLSQISEETRAVKFFFEFRIFVEFKINFRCPSGCLISGAQDEMKM